MLTGERGSLGRGRTALLCAPWALLYALGCGEDADPAPSRDAGGVMDGGVDAGPDAAAARDAAVDPMDAAPDPVDAGIDAAPATDAGTGEAGTDAAPDPDLDGGGEPAVDLPDTLAETGLYQSGSVTELADGVVAFQPAYALWSDSAGKRRWLYLPAGSQIDTSDMDGWRFPVDTKAWKEFSRDGKKLETRLLWKTAEGWFMMAFAWNDAETEAPAVPEGVPNARATAHDIPESGACRTCHDGAADALLGPSAIQLSHDGPGPTLLSLAGDGWLSDPPASGDYRLPAGADWAALGYMHANCGTCHNPRAIAFDRTDMELWLTVASVGGPITATPSYATTVGAVLSDDVAGFSLRVEAGSASQSGLVHRMEIDRGDDLAMPPLATEQVDTPNVDLVKAWIDGL